MVLGLCMQVVSTLPKLCWKASVMVSALSLLEELQMSKAECIPQSQKKFNLEKEKQRQDRKIYFSVSSAWVSLGPSRSSLHTRSLNMAQWTSYAGQFPESHTYLCSTERGKKWYLRKAQAKAKRWAWMWPVGAQPDFIGDHGGEEGDSPGWINYWRALYTSSKKLALISEESQWKSMESLRKRRYPGLTGRLLPPLGLR